VVLARFGQQRLLLVLAWPALLACSCLQDSDVNLVFLSQLLSVSSRSNERPVSAEPCARGETVRCIYCLVRLGIPQGIHISRSFLTLFDTAADSTMALLARSTVARPVARAPVSTRVVSVRRVVVRSTPVSAC
jgi:hypothetical protein